MSQARVMSKNILFIFLFSAHWSCRNFNNVQHERTCEAFECEELKLFVYYFCSLSVFVVVNENTDECRIAFVNGCDVPSRNRFLFFVSPKNRFAVTFYLWITVLSFVFVLIVFVSCLCNYCCRWWCPCCLVFVNFCLLTISQMQNAIRIGRAYQWWNQCCMTSFCPVLCISLSLLLISHFSAHFRFVKSTVVRDLNWISLVLLQFKKKCWLERF